jgi:hypothetical protein
MLQTGISDLSGHRGSASTEIAFPLEGPAGELIDLWRILTSHGMSSLPPMSIDEDVQTMEITNLKNCFLTLFKRKKSKTKEEIAYSLHI